MLTNKMSLDDHVKKINLAKSRVKNSIFEMAEAILNAVDQLEDQQKELADKLGMSTGTLSKWITIGSNNNLMNMKELVPASFDSLYQLSSLDKQYNKFYGKLEGEKKFFALFKDKHITPLSQRNDINKILSLHKQKIKELKNLAGKDQKTTIISKAQSEIKLNVLIKSKLHFNTIVVVPSDYQLNEWKKNELKANINFNYSISSLQNSDKNIFQVCLIKVKGKDIDVAFSALSSWGYNYNKMLTPKQPKNGLVDVSLDYFVLVGSKGLGYKDNFIIRSSENIDLIHYAEKIGSAPFLFVGEIITNKDWVYCVG